MRSLTFILLLLFITVSCEKEYDDHFHRDRTNYYGNELRIDGYYYYIFHIGNSKYYEIVFLYKNGVFLNGNIVSADKIEEKENRYISGDFYYNYAKDTKDCWGMFFIDNNEVSYEKYHEYKQDKYHTYLYKGNVINDTTFQITESFRYRYGKEKELEILNKKFRFKKITTKPDSLNSYIP